MADAVGTAVARTDGQLVAYYQPGGTKPLAAAHVSQITAAAAARAGELAALIDAAIAAAAADAA